MIRTLTAEFESVDLAELAIKKTKELCSGIKNVKIIKNKPNKKDFFEGSNALFNINVSSSMLPLSYTFYSPRQYYSEIDNNNKQRDTSVTIEIKCTNEELDRISQIITSLGAMSVKKI